MRAGGVWYIVIMGFFRICVEGYFRVGSVSGRVFIVVFWCIEIENRMSINGFFGKYFYF